ncbi:hypothetical protein [Anabaena lutea]|uniref:hypothetical protein n=1 Tax=Anabaena lutea TaxID=212350 RepID=UPI001682D3CE|nr:hypothetical protein [Anabaena lutea]
MIFRKNYSRFHSKSNAIASIIYLLKGLLEAIARNVIREFYAIASCDVLTLTQENNTGMTEKVVVFQGRLSNFQVHILIV